MFAEQGEVVGSGSIASEFDIIHPSLCAIDRVLGQDARYCIGIPSKGGEWILLRRMWDERRRRFVYAHARACSCIPGLVADLERLRIAGRLVFGDAGPAFMVVHLD